MLGKVDLFIFNLYKRSRVLDYVEGRTQALEKPQRFKLPTNPINLSVQTARIFTKQPTVVPGHFIVQDYGPDLSVLNVQTQIGNILKQVKDTDIAKKFGYDVSELNALAVEGSSGQQLPQSALNALSRARLLSLTSLSNLNYHEILTLSYTYQLFAALRDLYEDFDADEDILTLEFGSTAYRGYLTSFNYVVDAENPWNWKYDFVLEALDRQDKKTTVEAYETSLVRPGTKEAWAIPSSVSTDVPAE